MDKAMMAKAQEAKNVEELMELAKANHMELTEEKAQDLFNRIHTAGELSDEELDNVAGGGCGGPSPKYKVGDIVAIDVGKKCYYCGASGAYKITDVYWYTSDNIIWYKLECLSCRHTYLKDVPEREIIGRVAQP